ncbi:1-phosphatidylinositol 4-5-bisphosphate phosphodiesterase epsilon-1-like [Brachionus plicatilis]|uniref:1-phosphatidylinositol 4-5-bisphosphate phosphodiesterase epsilon-1-like n=1 Tax=Brachionus plicatilis TaxID=10195 RepID=A0A3M7RAR7_BRAPC|nr:1-phosphatidylinositol 4-5-bisphosphate phosphodiesterase epsilon-1-like [Brachionus plicatilis]
MTLLNQESEYKKSFDDSDLLYDEIDSNIVYSVASIRKHYVHGELVNVSDPYEGFIDLTCIKHIRQGCIDKQMYSQIHLIATTRYSITDFDENNIICLVYGNSFSENRSLYFIGAKQSIQIFYLGLSFLIDNLKKNSTLTPDNRVKWLKSLYLNLFYGQKNKKFRNPTPMEALLAFGGRQFNIMTLENHLNQAINNLFASSSYSNQNINHENLELELRHKNSIGTTSSQSSINKRKSSASITSFRLKNFKSSNQRKMTKSELITKKDVDVEKFIQNKSVALKSKFSKLKNFKNKSLMYDLFTRSSSASLDLHNSFDSDNLTKNRPVNSFRPPIILTLLSKPTEPSLISPLAKHQSVCSSSGVSTMRSAHSFNPYHLNAQNSFSSSSPPNGSSVANIFSNNFNFKFLTETGEAKLSSILLDTFIEFDQFVDLFKSFYVYMRKDLKDLFDRYAVKVSQNTADDIEKTWQKHRQLVKKLVYDDKSLCSEYLDDVRRINNEKTILTRNNLRDELKFFNLEQNFDKINSASGKYNALKMDYKSQLIKGNNKRLFNDLICSNSVAPYSINFCSELVLLNHFGQMQSANKKEVHEFYAINVKQLREFVANEQFEHLNDQELQSIINKHEPNAFFR